MHKQNKLIIAILALLVCAGTMANAGPIPAIVHVPIFLQHRHHTRVTVEWYIREHAVICHQEYTAVLRQYV